MQTNLRHETGRIEERNMSKINAVKQKHKEKIARKINPF